jgi:hypothetical protein
VKKQHDRMGPRSFRQRQEPRNTCPIGSREHDLLTDEPEGTLSRGNDGVAGPLLLVFDELEDGSKSFATERASRVLASALHRQRQ